MYIAVIVRKESVTRSKRFLGDYAAFVDVEKEDAVKRAIEARRSWERNGHGPYRILVGKLSAEVKVPVQFELVSLKGGE